MRGIFPETRKRWTDGLDFGIEDTRNYYEQMYWCFGGDSDAGGEGLSDEDIDQDMQQDIAAAAYGYDADEFGYSPGFDPDNLSDDQQTAVDASKSISDAAAFGQDAVNAAQNAANNSPSVSQALANLSGMTVSGYAPGQSQAQARQQAIERAYAVDRVGNPVTSNQGKGKVGRSFDPVTGRAPTASEKSAIQAAADIALDEKASGGFGLGLSDSITGDDTSDQGKDPDQTAAEFRAAERARALSQGLQLASPSLSAATDEILGRPSASVAATPGVMPASRSEAVSRALSDVPSSILGRPDFGKTNVFGIGQSLVDNELVSRATAGDQTALDSLSPAQMEEALDARFRAQAPVGIMSTPQATAANVLAGIQGNIAKAAENFTPGVSQPGQDPNFFSDLTQAAASAAAPGFRVDDIFTSPRMDSALQTTAPATSTTAPGQLSSAEMSALDALAARGFEDETAEMGLRAGDLTPDQIADNIAANTGYTDAGLPRGLDFVTTPGGVRASTNLAGPTVKQAQEAPGYLSTIDPVTGEVKEGFIPGAVNFAFGNPIQQAYGFEIPDYDPNNPDASTGQITGVVSPPAMGLPGPLAAGINFLTDLVSPDPKTISSSSELLTSMPSVYTGFGPGSELGVQDPDAGGRTDPPKAPNDPCPPGYQMINGTCTPVDQEQEEDPSSNFQINPVTGLPTLFAPFTQATPFAGANPFALQPYTPNQAQYIQEQRSGLQALSPTGAALGKQV